MSEEGEAATRKRLRACCGQAVPSSMYLGLCVGGLEPLAVEAMNELLTAWGGVSSCHIYHGTAENAPPVHEGRAGCGKLLFSSTAPAGVIAALPCFITVLAFLGCVHDLSMDEGPACQAINRAIEDSTRWDDGLVLWAQSHDYLWPVTQGPSRLARVRREGGEESFTFSFRASSVRDGRHGFNRMVVLPHMGDAVCSRFGEAARVSMIAYDMEVVAIIVDEDVHVGINLTDRTFRHCLARETSFPPLDYRDTSSNLRPSAAYLLVRLARPLVGEVLCDFMAGVGTIPVIAALSTCGFASTASLGGDIDPVCMEEAAGNVGALRRHGDGRERGADMVMWDAGRLPLRDGCVDVGITDLPFGKRCTARGGVQNLYIKVFISMARAVRVGGRLVVLVQSKKPVSFAMSQPKVGSCWRAVPPRPPLSVTTASTTTGVPTKTRAAAKGEDGESEGDSAAPPLPALAVNIGGLLSWVVCLERIDAAQDSELPTVVDLIDLTPRDTHA